MQQALGAHPMVAYLRAFMDFRDSKLKEARDGIEQVLKTAPDFLPGQLLAGSIYLRLNEQQRAQASLNKVLERVPNQPLARRLLVASLLASHDNDRAEEELQPLLANSKKDPAVLSLAGQVYLASGDFDRSSEYFEQVAKLAPEDAGARTRLGLARLAAGETQEAFSDLESAAGMGDAVEADTALVMAHLRRGELDKALDAQGRLEKKAPDSAQTYNLKGGVLLARKDIPGARLAFEKALTLQPTFMPAVTNLVRLDVLDKRPDDGKKRLQSVIDKDPTQIRAYIALSKLQAGTGATAGEVAATLGQAVAANPASITAKLALIQFYLATKDVKKALALAQEAQAGAPNDSSVILAVGRAELANGNVQQAISALTRLVNLQPRSPAALLELSSAQIVANDADGAERSLLKALDLKPDLVQAQQHLVALRIAGKRQEEALAVARTVQKQRPKEAAGYMLEGDVLVTEQKWEAAATSYRRGHELAMAPDSAIKLHATLTRAGKAADAARLASEWLKARPTDAAVRAYLAERALAEGNYADAKSLYLAVDELKPGHTLILNNLAVAAGKLHDPKAVGYAEQALKLSPGNPAILDTLGMIFVEKGEVAKGLPYLEQAVAKAPKALALRANYGQALAKADRNADARRELELVAKEAAEGSPLRIRAETLLKSL
jgi:putative PEP-CTERM system TPR-repeat lipoprotein